MSKYYDRRLHEVLTVGPQHHNAGGLDGYCEHWILEGPESGEFFDSGYSTYGVREGDRDCREPAVYVFKNTAGNRFRCCEAHKAFIENAEPNKGWKLIGRHPNFVAAHHD